MRTLQQIIATELVVSELVTSEEVVSEFNNETAGDGLNSERGRQRCVV